MNPLEKAVAIFEIAEHYGLDEQCRMLQEECAELIQAVSKYHRKRNEDTYKNVIEEMADVQIMIDQIAFLLNGNDMKHRIYSEKLERQIERMRGNE